MSGFDPIRPALNLLSDIELVARARANDPDAFGELVRRYQSPLRAWLRRLNNGDIARADDLAQDAFLKAYQRLHTFRGGGRFSAWLFAIAYNVFRNELRNSVSWVELDQELSQTLAVEETSEVEHAERMDLEVGLQRLTIDQRAAITLCYQQGLTHEEAAAVLHCPLGTVKTNILRAKESLRRYLRVPAPLS